MKHKSDVTVSELDPGPLVNTLLTLKAPKPHLSEIGKVAEIADGIVIVTGLERALSDEVLLFEGGAGHRVGP